MTLPRWLPLALLGAVVCVAAVGLLFSTFMMYDDEGYVLFSLQAFVDGGGLYERIYSQYGPFFFLFHQVLHLAGLEFTNDGARLLTLVNWLATAGLCGAIAWRLTRSTAATAFSFSGVFLHLWTLINEPSHPGGFIVFATALLAWLGTIWIQRPARLAAATGVIGAALVLTKINVGVFVLAGAGAWWFLHLHSPRLSLRLRAGVVGTMLAVLPFALMRDKLALGWVATFATIAAAAGAATVIAAARGAQPLTRWAHLTALGATALGVTVVTCAAILVQGTSAAGLLEGVLLGPLRFPGAYIHPVLWRPGALPLALLSLGVAAWAATANSPRARQGVAIGRMVAAAVFFATWALEWPLNSHAFALSFGLAATWLFVFPLEADRETQPARAWLALLLMPQVLHAFPVAGSQISWGSFLWIPLAAVGVHAATRELTAPWPAARRHLLAIAAALVVVATLARTAHYASLGLTRLREADSPGLPGTALLRLPPNLATTLRVLVLNTTMHADTLFTFPGMLSFHRWTGVPPPTPLNTTHWFTLLTPAQQEDIRARLEATPRSCIILQRHIYEFLVDTKVATESPLARWLKSNYETAFTLDSYEFWVRKGRRIAAPGTATAREGGPGVSPRYLISTTLALPAEIEVATVALQRFEGDVPRPITSWSPADAQLQLTPINSGGVALGPPQPLQLPGRARGLCRLELFTDRFPVGLPLAHAVLYFRDRTGRPVAEARFVP